MLYPEDLVSSFEVESANPQFIANRLIVELLCDIREFLRRTDVREQPDRVDERGKESFAYEDPEPSPPTKPGWGRDTTLVQNVDGSREFKQPGYGRCRTCCKWRPHGPNTKPSPGTAADTARRCARLPFGVDYVSNVPHPADAERWGDIWTGPDFGCIHYEEKTEVNA
jgi:hypothetical protein